MPSDTPLKNVEQGDLQAWARLQFDLDQHKAAFDAAIGAVKVAIFINGGASVAILTFLGNLIKEKPALVLIMSSALTSFGLGVLLGAIATGLACITQLAYVKHARAWGLTMHGLAVLSVVGAFWCFGEGALLSRDAFKGAAGVLPR